MQSRNRLFAVVTLPICAAILLVGGWLTSAGDLNPPAGSVAPTMKTLVEVEPRRAVQSLSGSNISTYVIVEPGSYYLTANIIGTPGKHGITINTEDVSIDLCGFSLVGVPGSRNGIDVQSVQCAVSNGSIVNWGESGVNAVPSHHDRYEKLRLAGNGLHGLRAGGMSVIVECEARNHPSGAGISTGTAATITRSTSFSNFYGFILGQGTTISECAAYQNLTTGINANEGCVLRGCTARLNGHSGISGSSMLVVDCTSLRNNGDGISAFVIRGCTATGNLGNGLRAGAGGEIVDCASVENGQAGILASDGCTVANCSSKQNVLDGIEAASACQIIQNNCAGNGAGAGQGAGIRVEGADNRIEGNNCTGADRGIDVDAAGNIIIKNTCSGNTSNWEIAVGNSVGPIVVAGTNAILISGNGPASSTLGSTDPNANHAY